MREPRTRRFFSYDEFLERAKTNKFMKFLEECSTISRTMFEQARANPYCMFFISIDIDKYLAKVGQPTVFNIWEEY